MGGVDHLTTRDPMATKAAIKARARASQHRLLLAAAQKGHAKRARLVPGGEVQRVASRPTHRPTLCYPDAVAALRPKAAHVAWPRIPDTPFGIRSYPDLSTAIKYGVIVAANIWLPPAVMISSAMVGALLVLGVTTSMHLQAKKFVYAVASEVVRTTKALGRGAVHLKEKVAQHVRYVAAAGGAGVATGLAMGLAGLGAIPALALACMASGLVVGAVAIKKYLGVSWWLILTILLMICLVIVGLACGVRTMRHSPA